MSLSQCLNCIDEQKAAISRCDIKFHQEKPTECDLVLDLTEDGLLLRFEPISQKLHTIEFYRLDRLVLTYNSIEFR